MKEKPLPQRIQDLIPTHIDHVVVDVGTISRLAEEEIHRASGQYAMEVIAARRRVRGFAFAHASMAVQAERMRVLEHMTPERFLGVDYDLKKKRLHLRGNNAASGEEGQYGYAFSSPPYNAMIRMPDGQFKVLSTGEINAFFVKIIEEVFHDFASPVSIYAWSNDWCDYFRPGLEWWGAFCWTLYFPDYTEVVMIAAATSD